MFLHEDEKLFRRIIEDTKKEIQLDYEIIEKDYYVTMILYLIEEKSRTRGKILSCSI